MRQLWRLHVRPKGGAASSEKSVDYCLRESVVGMGWSLPNEPLKRSRDFAWYESGANREYASSWGSVRAFARAARIGDLVWFRDTKGRYHIAELLDD